MGFFFDGHYYVSPTVASKVNDDAMRNANLTVGNVVAVVGRAAAGKPKTALRFGTPDEAAAALGSGELLDAVQAAFDPSSETAGPSEVIALRINPAVQATGVLKDSTAATVINLTSRDYGQLTNQIKIKVEAGTLAGKRVTVTRGQNYYSADNLTRNAFSVQYTGAAASATIAITGTTVTLEAPTSTVAATINLADFATVQELVDRIASTPGFTASVLEGNYTKPALNGLDYVTAQDVKTAAYTVKADLQAVVDWLNGPLQLYVYAERAANAGKPPAVVSDTYLTGGSDGNVTNTDWADAFEALQMIDVQWIAPVSGDAAIHAMADAHAQFMSGIGKRERRVIAGTAASTSQQAVLDAAKAINSDRTSLLFQGHYDYNAAGKLTLYPPYISAAKIAGGFSGVNPGTPLTAKDFACKGLEFELRNPIDTDVLIKGGVLCLENTEEGYKVVKSISTWLINDNYNRVEQSCGVALDFVVRNVRQALKPLIGQKGNPLVLRRAVSITESTLRELARAEPQGPEVIVGNDKNPAYRNITATLEGDLVRVQFECSPVIPVNYIAMTVYAVPFSGTATA